MPRRQSGLTDRKKRILEYLSDYQAQFGYPPSIREIGEKTGISSTSVVNYYLDQLARDGYIERESHISRGIRLLKGLNDEAATLAEQVSSGAQKVANTLESMLHIPVVGRIFASNPIPVPSSDFNYYDPETGIEIARSMLPLKERPADLFALEVQGDSMIDAMVNEGDIVVMRKVSDAKNGDMVAVWLRDRDETTLKYFYKEGSRVRLQPANPTMGPIMIDDPSTVEIQGQVVLVIRRMDSYAA